jgi:hypothetical protein
MMLHRHKRIFLSDKFGKCCTSIKTPHLSFSATRRSSAASVWRRSTRIFWLAAATLACAVSSEPVQAGACSTEFRELGGIADFPAVRSYVCTIGTDPQPSLRVTFMRLNEPLAGNLAKREPTPEFNQIFGRANVVANDVLKELEILFEKFGHKDVYPASSVDFVLKVRTRSANGSWEWKGISLSQTTPSGDRPGADPDQVQRLWSISRSLSSSSEVYPISLPTVEQAFRWTFSWPANFKHTYDCDHDPIECTLLWRYLELAELDRIEPGTTAQLQKPASGVGPDAFQMLLKEYAEKRSQRLHDTKSSAAPEISDWPNQRIEYRTHFALYRYIGRASWPKGFLIATGNLDACGGTLEFGYLARPVALEVAVVENQGSEQISIQDLLGTKLADGKLRVSVPPNANLPQSRLMQPGQLLGPGAKLVIPLKVIFEDVFMSARTPEKRSMAESMYAKIRAMRPGTVLSAQVGVGISIKKRQSSFLPPELPAAAEFAFGPELVLSGLLLEGEGLPLEERVVNFIALNENSDPALVDAAPQLSLTQNPTAQESCPYLYSWNEREQVWVNHGKVIHNANAPEKEEASVIKVSAKTTRIRLQEEEPEVSFIRRVQMIYTLKDGQRIEVNPVQGPASKKGARVIIPAYTSVEFQFKIPSGISPADIDRAEVAVTGYYLRYSTIRTSGRLTETRPKKL